MEKQRNCYGERKIEAPGGVPSVGFTRIGIQKSVPPDCEETIDEGSGGNRAGMMDRSAPASPEGLHSLIVAALGGGEGRQVFGLGSAADAMAPPSYWPSLPGTIGPSAFDGVRSPSPLRGSPGFAPGSLLIAPPERGRRTA